MTSSWSPSGKSSEGLGLGLPISLAIAREFGAALAARPRPEGGLAFDLAMEAEPTEKTEPAEKALRHAS